MAVRRELHHLREADVVARRIAERRVPPAATGCPPPAGPYVLVLRAYEGRAGVVAADWFPPDVTIADPAGGGEEAV